MKLTQYDTNVETSGIKSSAMKIEANAKAFSILLDRLYTDIKYAIVRELMTNGYDAQREAGNQHIPMQITLPSKWDKSRIVFRDFGCAMTPQVVEEVYSTLMASTKDDSDDDVGGWGIGSKTPFGYTKQLSLKSYLNGTCYTYHMFFDGKGVPQVAHIGTEETEELNGCEVSFEVKPGDATAFIENIKKVSKWFEVQPETSHDIGLEKLEYEKLIGPLYQIEPNNGVRGLRQLYVRQGCVAYPLDADRLTTTDKTTQDRLKNALTVIADYAVEYRERFLDVKIGSCDVTASRDALYYSDSTIDNLVDVLCTIYDEIAIECKANLDAATNAYEARRAKRVTMAKLGLKSGSSIVNRWFAGQTYNNEKLHTEFFIQNYVYDKEKGVQVRKFSGMLVHQLGSLLNPRYRMTFPSRPKDFTLNYTHEILVVLDQLNTEKNRFTHRRGERMAILANAGMGQGNYRTILWCAVSGDDLSGYKEFLQLIGNPPTLNLADVELPVREALPKADAEARRDVYRVCDSRRPKTVEVLTYDEIEDLMANDEFMYIHTFRSTPAEKYGKSWDTLDRIADMLEIDDTDKVKVILVTKTNYRLFKSRLKGKQDYVEYLMEGLKSKFDLKRHCELSSIVDEHFVRWRKHELVELSEDFVTFAGGDLADPASYTCKIEEPFIKETLTFFDAVDHMDTQLDESKKILDALMLHLPMNEKEALRLRIETTQAGMKPKIKVSDLDDRLKTIFRHYKWLAFHYAKSIDQPNYEDEWVAMMNKAIALDPLK